MKGLVANAALERLLPRVGQSVVLVVALLVEALAAKLADPGTITLEDRKVVKPLPYKDSVMWWRT